MKLNRSFVNNYYVRNIINFARKLILITKFYLKKSCKKKGEEKSGVVFQVNGYIKHGGLADRLYGILNAYAICKIKSIPFYINYIYPYNLKDFLEPNEVNWSISENDILYSHRIVKVKFNMGGCIKNKFNGFECGKQIHLYSNYKWLDYINSKYDRDFTYSGLFNELFAWSPQFMDVVNKIFFEKFDNQPYISLQVRVQNAFGDFKDVNSVELLKDQQEELLDICKTKIKFLYNKYNLKILLTSDSSKLIEILLKDENLKNILIILDGKISHTDLVSDGGFEKNLKTFVDLYFLSLGEAIYQIKNPYIYNSGFSKLASEISNKKISYC